MTGQEILDDPGAAYPQLRQFLGAYFHQDWAVDCQGWEEVVDDFLADSPRSAVIATAEEMRGLLATGVADADLDTVLNRLDSNVTPSALDMGAAEWLAAVLRRLDAEP